MDLWIYGSMDGWIGSQRTNSVCSNIISKVRLIKSTLFFLSLFLCFHLHFLRVSVACVFK